MRSGVACRQSKANRLVRAVEQDQRFVSFGQPVQSKRAGCRPVLSRHVDAIRARLGMQSVPYALLRDLFSFRFLIQDNDSAQAVKSRVAATSR